jgi:hypothetical protein
MVEQQAEQGAKPDNRTSLANLSLEVRAYLTALHVAAGLAPPDLPEEQIQAALRQALPENASPPVTDTGGLLPWLASLPNQAFGQVQSVWTDWLKRFNAIDQEWPMRLFHATHNLVGERLQQLGVEVRRVAGEKLTALEGRYGRTGAILVLTAAVALTPVPVPGTTFAPVLVAEGIRAVGQTFWGEGTPASENPPK